MAMNEDAFLSRYSGATRVIYIVGDPIAQVKSPSGVTRLMQARGADAVCVPAHVAPEHLADWCAAIRLQRNVDGIIVTVPHKFAVLPLCDELTPRARSIGAVNILRRHAPSGGWTGDMCDGDGHVAGMRSAGAVLAGRRALLVGAGGAGSAIAHALVDAGVAALDLLDADAARREALADKLRRYAAGHAQALALGIGSADPTGYDLVTNATPLGMKPTDPLPVDVSKLAVTTFVSDVVTQPALPPLIEAARARGCATLTGIGMFEAVRDRMVDFYLA
ncbi:shikimate dehydrogenase family protein [Leptothrix discophora]|uniref:Shikimate dehydrogenase n=1 Tax=Leptothrix discophora TaxID=89 RepID=A0ABT9FZ01_LEPDI|nr:shikimate dehydrogenase [Leptothrix discophora]MDP4299193.1 shikimate dehydrogenase [Leptothrix discophora]